MAVQLNVGKIVSRSEFCGNSKMARTSISADDARRLIGDVTDMGFKDVSWRLIHRKQVLVTIVSPDYIEGLIMEKDRGHVHCFVVLHEYSE